MTNKEASQILITYPITHSTILDLYLINCGYYINTGRKSGTAELNTQK